MPGAVVDGARQGAAANEFDVVVIGAGIAGATLGAALAQEIRRQRGGAEARVLVAESRSHPRFRIGESTVPSTTAGFNLIAKRFGVSELEDLTTFIGSKKAGLVSWPKSHFWFGYHGVEEEGRGAARGLEMKPKEELVFETYRPPLGPDSHLERAPLDRYLSSLLPKYGVDFRERTSVIDVDLGDGRDGGETAPFARVQLRSTGEDGGRTAETVHAKLVVDCGGHTCFLANRLGLMPAEGPALQTRTRVIYGHFAYGDDFSLDEACGGPHTAFRYRRDAGTMHHCFHGGWIWVIPFDNGTVSVGILLDVDQFPYDAAVSKDDEFWGIVNRFPTVKKHLGQLKATRTLSRQGRVQIRATHTVGHRFLLAPHAAGFIDPLFSTGINLTTRFVLRATPKIAQFVVGGAPSGAGVDLMAPFRSLDTDFCTELDFIDNMVRGTIASFRSFKLFRAFWRVWIDATTRQIQDVQVHNQAELPLYGSHDAKWSSVVAEAADMVYEHRLAPPEGDPPANIPSADEVAAKLKALLDTSPASYDVFPMRLFAPSWELDFPHRLNVLVPVYTSQMMRIATQFHRPLHVVWWTISTIFILLMFWLRYAVATVLRQPFARHVDTVSAQLVPQPRFAMIKTGLAVARAVVFGVEINAEVRKKRKSA